MMYACVKSCGVIIALNIETVCGFGSSGSHFKVLRRSMRAFFSSHLKSSFKNPEGTLLQNWRHRVRTFSSRASNSRPFAEQPLMTVAVPWGNVGKPFETSLAGTRCFTLTGLDAGWDREHAQVWSRVAAVELPNYGARNQERSRLEGRCHSRWAEEG